MEMPAGGMPISFAEMHNATLGSLETEHVF